MKVIPKHTLDFIDFWLTLRYKWETIPGIAVAIAKDGEIVFNKSYGYANLDSQEKLRTDHLFRIASHSKTFTATLIMQLQEQGKLRIDDLVYQHLDWLKEHRDERWKTVTLRQLMNHSAGIVRDGIDTEYWNAERDFPEQDEIRKVVMSKELVIEPNTKLKYSNFGYGLLGMVIEKVTSSGYSDVLSEKILKPLELTNTFPELPSNQNRLATGYSREDLNRVRYPFPQIDTKGLAAATGLCSTAADLARYFSVHRIGTGELLHDASKQEMHKTHWEIEKLQNSAYGLGLQINTEGKRRRIGHGGGFPGVVTSSYLDVDDGICVVVLANARDAWSKVINNAIFDIIDEFGDTTPDTSLSIYEGLYVEEYGMSYIYANSNGLRALSPNSWSPTSNIVQLARNGKDTFVIAEDTGTGHFGEEVKFTVSGDKISSILYAGAVLRPSKYGDIEPRWMK